MFQFPDKLPEIPNSWQIIILLSALVLLRTLGIDTFVTAALMATAGYITGKHLEEAIKKK